MKRFWIAVSLLLALSLVSVALAAETPVAAPAAPVAAAAATTPVAGPGFFALLPTPAPAAVAPWLQGIATPEASQTCPCLACSHIGLICCHPPNYQCGCADDVSQCTPL